ncbi:hypothetical protein BSL82_02915 [Tardibacter chloracetimidivorans]|uniref:Uncharacterized protein n=1 Tax=Tardibacter chloracetimidivorans TaxID=1921510 RepID=A0A1L3ZRZ4_9SPHN|nr:hypothetical protein [Tardibacter chloracetimidivorans]API58385.1 hypothetical protein BSL82_02915 [Tardibacter chloracetimidivorans]
MLKNILGAAAGYAASKNLRSIDGAAGATLGAVAASVIARMSLIGLAGVLAGGYLVKNYLERP